MSTEKQTEDNASGPLLGLGSSAGLGLALERDAVLAQLDDRINQTWAAKRARWAALVRGQDAEIARLQWVCGELRGCIAQMERDEGKKVAAERERFRAALQAADTIMGHEDACTEWREKWAHLWPNA